MPSSAIENIAGSTFGSTSRKMMRRFLAPWPRAASTNSRCDHVSVFARVMRAEHGDRHDAEGEDQRQSRRRSSTVAVEARSAQHRDEREREDQRGIASRTSKTC